MPDMQDAPKHTTNEPVLTGFTLVYTHDGSDLHAT